MDATLAMDRVGTEMHQILPPIQITTTGEPISLTDQVVQGIIAGIIVAAIVARLRGRERR